MGGMATYFAQPTRADLFLAVGTGVYGQRGYAASGIISRGKRDRASASAPRRRADATLTCLPSAGLVERAREIREALDGEHLISRHSIRQLERAPGVDELRVVRKVTASELSLALRARGVREEPPVASHTRSQYRASWRPLESHGPLGVKELSVCHDKPRRDCLRDVENARLRGIVHFPR